MSNLTETTQQDTEPELTQAPSHDEVLALEAQELAAWRQKEREEDLRYRYCDDPFCSCTPGKMRFLKLVGVLDGWGDLSRYGQRLQDLWNADPASAAGEAGSRGPSGRAFQAPKPALSPR